MTSDLDLLRQFAQENSQDAFGEILRRHLDLVYSAALRQVRSRQLAEDVAQSVFADLARDARKLKPDTVLTAWLYAVARRTAIDTVRKETRRQLREQIAVEMNDMNATADDWAQIAPLLDDAMAALDETDRTAILLRYFENKSLREVGESLKISDDAAQKRVSRAVESLREFFSKQRLTIGAGGLVVLISANAVQSAPIGLAATISAAALMGIAQTSTVITATKTIAMTTLQKSIIVAALASVAVTGIYAERQNSALRGQIQTLRQQQTLLTGQIQGLQQEQDDATNRLAALLAALLADNAQQESGSNQSELLRLRGEVTQLKNNEAQKENDPVEATAKIWANRANQVKEWLSQTPDQSIPELQLLPAGDWLQKVGAADFWSGTTNNFSFILGLLRTDAKQQFASDIGTALDNYLLANGGQLPSDLSALTPYLKDNPHYSDFSSDTVDSMLQRYELLQSGNVNILPQSEPLISEKLPIQNAQYDASFEIGAFDYSYTGVSPVGHSGRGHVSTPTPNKLKELFKSQ